MQKITKPKAAYGRVVIDWQIVMMILARGHHAVEKIYTLPKLPSNVFVRSVHNDPSRMGFTFLLESSVPIDGWTAYCEEGCEIPLSPAGLDLRSSIFYNKEYQNKAYVLKEDFEFPEDK